MKYFLLSFSAFIFSQTVFANEINPAVIRAFTSSYQDCVDLAIESGGSEGNLPTVDDALVILPQIPFPEHNWVWTKSEVLPELCSSGTSCHQTVHSESLEIKIQEDETAGLMCMFLAK